MGVGHLTTECASKDAFTMPPGPYFSSTNTTLDTESRCNKLFNAYAWFTEISCDEGRLAGHDFEPLTLRIALRVSRIWG